MSHRLLIIGDAPESLCHLGEAGSALHDLVLSRIDWPSLRLESLDPAGVDVIVPVIGSDVSASRKFLDSLNRIPLRKPTMAYLSTGCDATLFTLASSVADDYVTETAPPNEIRQRLLRLVGRSQNEATAARQALTEEIGLAQLVGSDPAFLVQIRKIPLLARSTSPVFISGETGTGKELCARAIHALSDRHDQPFIPLDCGAFPDHLFENEMFGHVRGAYTDAHRDQKGMIALAEGGTLFLDEVDSLSPAAQSKLLRFLQEHTYRPLGSDRFVTANVRIVAASNRDLEAMTKTRQFRLDLFYRLCVLRLHAMALRERRGDVEHLAAHFLGELCRDSRLPRKNLASSTGRMLREHDWPGNVRELYNVIQQCVTFTEGCTILPQHLPPTFGDQTDTEPLSFNRARNEVLQAFERRYIEDLMRECGGNVTHAARLAQKERRVFGRMVKRHNIKREP